MYATMKIVVHNIYILRSVVLFCKHPRKTPPTQRNNKIKISQISCSYRGIIIPFAFWNDGEIIRKSIRFLNIEYVCPCRTKAKASHKEWKKEKHGAWTRARKRDRELTMCGKFGQLVYFVGTFRKKNIHMHAQTHTHARARYSLKCMSTVIHTIHKAHIRSHTSTCV